MSRITFASDITISGTSEFKVNDTEDITTRDSGSMLTYGGLNVYKKTLLQDDIIIGGNIDTQKRYPNWPSWVIGYYDFADSTNLGNDVSNYGYNAVNYSGYYSSTIGSRSNIANFSQTQGTSGTLTQRIELLNAVYKDLRNFSVSLWIYVDTPVSTEMCIVAFSDSSTVSTTKIKLFIDTSNFINFALFNGGSTIFMVKSTSVIPDLTWTHIVISAGETGNWMYVNGVLQTNYTTSSGSNTSSISTLNSTINYSLIGANINTSGFIDGFGGSMADVLFTDTQLTAGVIGNLYADNYGYEVYSLMGQSNMVGYALIDAGIDDDYTIVSGKVYQYPYDINNPSSDGVTFGTTITDATNPLDFISGVTGGSVGETAGKMGMWKTFVENLVPKLSPHRKILLIPAAKGGTSFSAGDWLLTGAIYTAAKGATSAALNLNTMNTLRGILWIQGESDADVENHNYLNELSVMYSDLSSTFGEFPFIMSTILGSSAGSTAISDLNNLLYTFSKNRGIFIIDTSDLSKSDIYHYKASSLRTIGERMYYALAQQANVNNFNKDTSFYNRVYLNNTTNAMSNDNGGALTIRGGGSVTKDFFTGGTIYTDNTFGFDKIQQLTYINSSGYQVKTSSTATPITTDLKVINKRTRVTPQTVADTVSTWTSRTSAADNNWTSVCWSPELKIFVAISDTGTGNRVMTSSDGITWTSRTSAADNSWRSVTWSPELGLFAAVGVSGTGNRVMTSSNGTTWTSRTSAADDNFQSICWSPELGLFVAVASSGVSTQIMTSSNGTTWTSRSGPAVSNQWISVCWSPELSIFVAIASTLVTNSVMTSPDGIVWTNRNVAAVLQWFAVAWSPELYSFAAVASTGTGNRVMTSSDGITWTSRTSAADNNWNKITWSKELSLFVAVATSGTGNRIMTSSDLVTWTTRTNPVDNDWSGICWSPQLSIFAGVSKTGSGNRVMTSAIGIPDRLSTILVNPSHLSNNDGVLSFSKTITSTLSTGTAPFTVASTTNVANLNASSLSGATFTSPGAIGGTVASSGAFTTISASNTITSTLATASTSSSTGSVLLSGGISISNSTDATSSTNGGTFTTAGGLSAAKQIISGTTVTASRLISNVATGTAPFTVSSTTNVANLNASSLSGATFASPGAIGGTAASTGAFTTISATGAITSTVATGTAPFTVASTTNVPNLNASTLSGATFASPGSIGSTVAGSGAFTTIDASGVTTISNTTATLSGGTNNAITSTTGAFNVKGDMTLYNTASGGGIFSFARNDVTGAPTFTNRSLGTRLVLYPNTYASSVDMAMGFNSNDFWASTYGSMSWYVNTTKYLSLTSTAFSVLSTTNSTSNSTGALLLSGGIGISNSTDASSSTNGGTITTAGGIAAAKKIFGGDTITATNGISGSTLTSTVSTGTAPLVVASTTNVPNLNASTLSGATFASPGPIGSTSASTGLFTILNTAGTVSSAPGSGLIFKVNDSTWNDSTTSNGATASTVRVNVIGQPTLTSTNGSVTTTNASTFIINGAPVSSASNTVINAFSLLVLTGTSVFGGLVNCNVGTASTSNSTGSIITNGGFSSSNTTDAVSATNGGTFTTAGGLSAAKQIISGTNVTAVHFNTGYSTTATAAGTTTLTATSNQKQFFTGATTQTVVLPVTSTLVLGFEFQIVNLSSGSVTVQSSGANTVVTVAANTRANLTCILTTGTTAASWSSV